MIALPWKKLCANFILPCGENHYGFFLRCPTSFYNQPIYLFVCFWGFILLKYQTHIKTTILLSAFWGLVIMFLCLHPSLLGIDVLYMGTRLESNLERFLWRFAQPQLAVILFTALITLYYSLCKRSRSPQ